MVGKDTSNRSYSLEQVLTDEHVRHILEQITNVGENYELVYGEAKPAAEGLAGFLGDHIRAVLHVKVRDEVKIVHLFVKRMPMENKPKAEFIELNNYFKREKLMLRLLDDVRGDKGPHPWCVRAYIYTESLVVMPDVSVAGYCEHPLLDTLDLRHVTLTAASLARYHAAFANYETKIASSVRPYSFYDKYKHLLVEPTFQNTPWVRTAAKLTADILDAFSLKYSKASVPDLEDKIAKANVDACESLDVAENDLNVMLHKDLWNNNILFQYEDGTPRNAVLIDYQCVRYGPPAFDLMSFLYLTTSRLFRQEYECKVLKYYFEVFNDSLENATRIRLGSVRYNEREFFRWCEKSRMFGVFEAVALLPQVLMDAKAAQKIFDDPDTYLAIAEQDRSAPVVEYARESPLYLERQLEIAEEYVETFVLDQQH